MSHKQSGLWCDLCETPILSGEYWHIRIQGKAGHACEKCKDKHDKLAGDDPLDLSNDEFDEVFRD